MSRIGKLPILVPKNVSVKVENDRIIVKGKFGTLKKSIPEFVKINNKNDTLLISIATKIEKFKAVHGLYRALINNMLVGVSKQFTKNIILKGIGYKSRIQNNHILLSLGYSHNITLSIPENISIEVTKNINIKLVSCDKDSLGLFTAKIRSLRKLDPYKGKGILFKDERIIRKIGKSTKV